MIPSASITSPNQAVQTRVSKSNGLANSNKEKYHVRGQDDDVSEDGEKVACNRRSWRLKMLYIRVCYDKSGMGELRDKLRNNHRAYFKPNLAGGDAAVRLVQAGPLCTSDNDTTNIGSFMIL